MNTNASRITALEPVRNDPCLIEVMIDGVFFGTAQREDVEASKAGMSQNALIGVH